MFDLRYSRAAAWSLAVGAAAGVAAAAVWTVRRQRPAAPVLDSERIDLEERVVDALMEDADTARSAIEVAAIGPGVVELTGMVATAPELRRAIDVTQAVEGVSTVVNRLEIGIERSRRRERRQRYDEGDPALTEQQWYGVGVGTGRRRQGDTEPDRPDDRVDMVTQQFDDDRAYGDVEKGDPGG